jgi:DNA-binding response OmpR family regulator
MRILIADDDPVSRQLLQLALLDWGYEVVTANDGNEAWQMLQSQDPPSLMILDWMMPGLDGIEICQRVRQTPHLPHVHLILLTGKYKQQDIVAGLQAGADDYLTKPFNLQELRARLQAGGRIVQEQTELAQRVKELEGTLAQAKHLEGYLSICSYCKKIRDDENDWQQFERYFELHSQLLFSHSICPTCYKQHIQPELDALDQLEDE